GWSPQRPGGQRRPPGPPAQKTPRPRRRGREPLPDPAGRVGDAPGPTWLAPAPCPPRSSSARTVAITPAAPVRRTQPGPSRSIIGLSHHTAGRGHHTACSAGSVYPWAPLQLRGQLFFPHALNRVEDAGVSRPRDRPTDGQVPSSPGTRRLTPVGVRPPRTGTTTARSEE